jgi:4-hydroxy-tetrahydrodipicolinate reductase
MTKVAVLGAAGRMGVALVRAAAARPDVTVAAAVETPGHRALGADAGRHAGIDPLGVCIADALPGDRAAVDVLIDFTFHGAAPAHAALAAERGHGLVLGTTGLTDSEAAAVRAAAERAPVVWAPNMSLGVNVLFALVERAASVLGPDYDIELVEAHHRHKKDAPSGTALELARRAAAGRGQDLDAVACYGRQGQTGERPRGQIGMHAVRGGDIVGEHRVLFAAEGESIELAHRASRRDAFAGGALAAAVWLHGRAPGLYDMRAVLGL